MGCSRMGFDLFTKHGWLNLWFSLRHRGCEWKTYVLGDTFGRFRCIGRGHDTYDSGTPPMGHWWDLACRRCHKYVGKPAAE